MDERAIRLRLFEWLNEQSILNNHVFSWQKLASGFVADGKVITLIGRTGIWTPAGFSMPISITTSIKGIYRDEFSDNGDLIYRYRGTDPKQRDNIGLRNLMRNSEPLVYFHGIKRGKYVAYWPVYIKEDYQSELAVRVELNPVYMMHGIENSQSIKEKDNPGFKKYIWVTIRQRLHQSAFREFVLDAYDRKCTLCKLQHEELLDAAHIIPDNEERGEPIVKNGLSLCKIHHAAFDKNIIGISPDYIVKVRRDILEEEDGPMLKYGLQAMEGNRIIMPVHRKDYPDRERLDARYRRFMMA